MAYIGKQPVVGNFVKLDAIVTSATATYNLLNGGTAYFPQTANNCIVSLNGVIQSPTSAYTISGSTIVFSDALTASDSIDFILVLGDVLNIGTPSDNTVSTAKLVDANVTTAKLVDGSVTAAKVAAGAVVQVVSTTKTDTYTEDVSANSLSTNLVTGLQPSITPSSASNKILILININIGYESADVGDAPGFLLRRSNTGIAKGDTAGNRTSMTQLSWLGSTDQMVSTSMNFLDSPNTTSSTTYAISLFNGSGSSRNVRINRTHSDADFNYRARTISTITLIEIKG